MLSSYLLDKSKKIIAKELYSVKEIEKQQETNPLNSLRISLENYPIGFVSILKISASQLLSTSEKDKNSFYQKFYDYSYNYSAFQPPDLV